MGKKKIITKPKSNLGLNDKLKICYNCCFYQQDNNGWCTWENNYMNYNDHCTIILKHWPSTFFRYKFELGYTLEDTIKIN
jgi:hypothetical protein